MYSAISLHAGPSEQEEIESFQTGSTEMHETESRNVRAYYYHPKVDIYYSNVAR